MHAAPGEDDSSNSSNDDSSGEGAGSSYSSASALDKGTLQRVAVAKSADEALAMLAEAAAAAGLPEVGTPLKSNSMPLDVSETQLQQGEALTQAAAAELLTALVALKRIPLALEVPYCLKMVLVVSLGRFRPLMSCPTQIHEAMRLAKSGPSRPGWRWPGARVDAHAALVR